MAASDDDARARWIGWQQAHQEALKALQSAEAAYHRLTAEHAFGRGAGDASRLLRLEALTRLEERRVLLDQIRGHQPPWPY
jgi:hypothetical protein